MGGHAFDDLGVHGGIAHQTVLAHLLAPGFELRLDERDDVGAGGQQRRQRRQYVPERDERHVDGDEIDRMRHVGPQSAIGRSRLRRP